MRQQDGAFPAPTDEGEVILQIPALTIGSLNAQTLMQAKAQGSNREAKENDPGRDPGQNPPPGDRERQRGKATEKAARTK